ncbi:MAG: hypothetical protein RR855_10505 [Comamonas sp.]
MEPATELNIGEALEKLGERFNAMHMLPHMADKYKNTIHNRKSENSKDLFYEKKTLELSSVLYSARKISLQEYIFYTSHIIENVHDTRIEDGDYPALKKISDEMKLIEISQGLQYGEYWSETDAPPQWLELANRWEEVEEKFLQKTFFELEGGLATDLLINQKTEFNRLRERGRRAHFHNKELIPSLIDTIKRYEFEAQSAAQAKAYTAAITIIGAALEGLLLLRCLHAPQKAARVSQDLPRKNRPKIGTPPTKWTFDTLIHVCLASGWLPPIKNKNISINPEEIAHWLRQMRNNIHPGRVCTDSPWVESEFRDFRDAELIYAAIFATVFRKKKLVKFNEVNDNNKN